MDRVGGAKQPPGAEEAWAEFREHPSTFSYEELMRFVPKAERAAWHAKAMDAVEPKPRTALRCSVLCLHRPHGERDEREQGQAASETPAKIRRTVPLDFKDTATGEHFDVV